MVFKTKILMRKPEIKCVEINVMKKCLIIIIVIEFIVQNTQYHIYYVKCTNHSK